MFCETKRNVKSWAVFNFAAIFTVLCYNMCRFSYLRQCRTFLLWRGFVPKRNRPEVEVSFFLTETISVPFTGLFRFVLQSRPVRYRRWLRAPTRRSLTPWWPPSRTGTRSRRSATSRKVGWQWTETVGIWDSNRIGVLLEVRTDMTMNRSVPLDLSSKEPGPQHFEGQLGNRSFSWYLNLNFNFMALDWYIQSRPIKLKSLKMTLNVKNGKSKSPVITHRSVTILARKE